MRSYFALAAIMLVLCPLCIYAQAAEFSVKQDGTGDFTTIQAAIDVAMDGDEIVVHPGRYCENIRFEGKNIALRSVDPEDEEIVASTVIDGQEMDSVITFSGTEDESCTLDGFTITRGYAKSGAGILGGDPSSDSPVCTLAGISNCRIKGNSGLVVGGIGWCAGAIVNCVISGNSAGYWGGGIGWCDGTISICTISGNSSGWGGGGLAWCDGAISNCTISGNSGVRGGGGL
ncbi:MAG: hypothetical protein JW941_00090, partial [Candidatus Coatesbacteria bacterium]|nr:hypothetical protein [Candidatus Coatesbacteria bacterium]